MERKNKGKLLPHVIKVLAFFVIIVLTTQSCTTYPSSASEEPKEIIELAKSRQKSDLITKSPLVGEIILGIYEDTLDEESVTMLTKEGEDAFNSGVEASRLTKDHPVFHTDNAIAILLTLANQEYPDINLNDLDIRSFEYQQQVGESPAPYLSALEASQHPTFWTVASIGMGISQPACNLVLTERYHIKGTVVKRSPDNKYMN